MTAYVSSYIELHRYVRSYTLVTVIKLTDGSLVAFKHDNKWVVM